jgi:hypothetical protein
MGSFNLQFWTCTEAISRECRHLAGEYGLHRPAGCRRSQGMFMEKDEAIKPGRILLIPRRSNLSHGFLHRAVHRLV